MIQALASLVDDPEPEHPLRADLAEEYTKDHKKFCKIAEQHTKKYAESRPADNWRYAALASTTTTQHIGIDVLNHDNHNHRSVGAMET